MARSLHAAVLAVVFALRVVNANTPQCSFPPVVPFFSEVGLDNGETALGIKASLGSIRQPISLLPSAELNNTYVYDENHGFCGKNSTQFCTSWRGDLFNVSLSTTRQDKTSPKDAGASPNDYVSFFEGDLDATQWITDSLDLSNHTDDLVLDNMPIGLLRAEYGSSHQRQHVLGLGPESTLLKRLVDMGRIGSRSWSFYWGGDGYSVTTEGSVVFGGYDRQKTLGKGNVTLPIQYSRACKTGLAVSMSEVSLNFPNGTSPDLLAGIPLGACIVPDWPGVISLPPDQRFEWEDITGTKWDGKSKSLGVNYGSAIFPSNATYNGDLSITLGPGFTVRVPNSQLVMPDRTIAQNGSTVWNDAAPTRELLVDFQQYKEMPRLGRAFFTSALLVVNYDDNTFTVTKADVDDRSTTPDLVSIWSPATRQMCAPTPNTPSAGLIAGVVVASVAATALAILAFFLLRRRRRRNAAAASRHHHLHSSAAGSAEHLAELSAPSEKHGGGAYPKDMLELETGGAGAYVELNSRRSIGEIGGRERRKGSLIPARAPNGGAPAADNVDGRGAARVRTQIFEMPAGEWTAETTPTGAEKPRSPAVGRMSRAVGDDKV